MYSRRVPVILVNPFGDRSLGGHALVESQSLDVLNDVKITLAIDIETPKDSTVLMIQFISPGTGMGTREEIVITEKPADPKPEPEFRIKGL